jgi:hypothetical protein
MGNINNIRFVLSNLKYYTKLKDKENWIEVKDPKMVSEIEKIFTNAGLVKDQNNIAYMK